MKALTLITTATLLATGCTGVGTNTVTIRWERLPLEQLVAICMNPIMQEKYKNRLNELDGCSAFTQTPCLVYTRDTIKENSILEQVVLGHEAMHCFKGYYHPQ